MGKMKWDPEIGMWRVKLDPNAFTPKPLKPEHERIIKANQLRVLREAGYLPPKEQDE